jgi:hypothetical protein
MADIYKRGGHIGKTVDTRRYRVKFDNRRSIDLDNFISDDPNGNFKL